MTLWQQKGGRGEVKLNFGVVVDDFIFIAFIVFFSCLYCFQFVFDLVRSVGVFIFACVCFADFGIAYGMRMEKVMGCS